MFYIMSECSCACVINYMMFIKTYGSTQILDSTYISEYRKSYFEQDTSTFMKDCVLFIFSNDGVNGQMFMPGKVYIL